MAKMWAALNLAAVMVVVLLGMAQQSMQLSPKHSKYQVLQRINANGVSYLGIIVTSSTDEAALVNSTYFEPSSSDSEFDYLGRKFHIGTINSTNVVVLNAGGDIPNVVLSTQLLFDLFSIDGIIHFGSAGSVDEENLLLGDVAVPKTVAYTGNWEWKSNTSKKGKLKFGDFNLPTKGNNSLGSVDFQKVKVSTADNVTNYLWLPVNDTYYKLASDLQDLKLQQCVNEINVTNCLDEEPVVYYGAKVSTADVYLKNAAYGYFLYNRLNVNVVDTTSAAVVLASLTNGVPSIVFRAVSNSVITGVSDSNARTLATANGIRITIKFIELLGQTTLVSDS